VERFLWGFLVERLENLMGEIVLEEDAAEEGAEKKKITGGINDEGLIEGKGKKTFEKRPWGGLEKKDFRKGGGPQF